jgi:hypothetical protein
VAAKRKKKPSRRGPSSGIQVRRAADGKSYEFLYPSSVRERSEDMEEVRAMLAAGEADIAIDELRWLLGGCHELLEAHQLLGALAAEDGDRELARAHFGYAFQLGLDALPKRGLDHPLPHANPANTAFHEAGAGLIRVLLGVGESNQAKEVAMQLLALDPTDPLGVKATLEPS